MNDNDFWSFIFLIAIVISLVLMGAKLYEEGHNSGVNETLILCIENQKECKIKYDYIKLEANQK